MLLQRTLYLRYIISGHTHTKHAHTKINITSRERSQY